MNQTLLPTVLLFIRDSYNVPQLCRALLDSGAQKTLITESKTGVATRSCKRPITRLNMFKSDTTHGKAALNLLSRIDNNVVQVNSYIVSKISSNLPVTSIECGSNGIQCFTLFCHLTNNQYRWFPINGCNIQSKLWHTHWFTSNVHPGTHPITSNAHQLHTILTKISKIWWHTFNDFV
jgi:hypothetical protein